MKNYPCTTCKEKAKGCIHTVGKSGDYDPVFSNNRIDETADIIDYDQINESLAIQERIHIIRDEYIDRRVFMKFSKNHADRRPAYRQIENRKRKY